MAVWQFIFSVIPEAAAVKINNEVHNDHMLWDGFNVSNLSIKELSKMFKPTRSWSKSIRQYGSLDGTCVELIFEKSKLNEVSIRFDLRNLSQEQLLKIIKFIKDNNAIILTQGGVLLKPTLDSLIGEIKKAHALAFVKNPEEYLQKLK